MCEGKETPGKNETSPSRKRDTALEAICSANAVCSREQAVLMTGTIADRTTSSTRGLR